MNFNPLQFLKNLFPSLPSLDEYTIADRPRRSVEIKKERRAEGTVSGGKEWRTEQAGEGNTASWTIKVNADAPASPALVVLDEYDTSLLEYVLGAKWRGDEARAKVLRWHWLRGESALDIEKYHTANGKLERGYSERTVADYIKAFYAADARRGEDGRERLRAAPTPPPANKVDWG